MRNSVRTLRKGKVTGVLRHVARALVRTRRMADFLRDLDAMTDDIRKLQNEMLEMMKRVGPRTRYRLLEIHERLSDLAERPTTPSTGGGWLRTGDRMRTAA